MAHARSKTGRIASVVVTLVGALTAAMLVAHEKQRRRPDGIGGFFWLNDSGGFNLPRDAYYAAGAGGQFAFIVPSRQLVIVRAR